MILWILYAWKRTFSFVFLVSTYFSIFHYIWTCLNMLQHTWIHLDLSQLVSTCLNLSRNLSTCLRIACFSFSEDLWIYLNMFEYIWTYSGAESIYAGGNLCLMSNLMKEAVGSEMTTLWIWLSYCRFGYHLEFLDFLGDVLVYLHDDSDYD
jgi:hypothetical protein